MQYTNVMTFGDNIFYRGIDNGKRRIEKIKFNPSLFVQTDRKSSFKSIYGDNLGEIKFDSIRESRSFIEKYKDVKNYPIFGNTSSEYCYIATKFPHDIDWKFDDILIANIDIEVGSESGFPDPKSATAALQAITMRMKGKTWAFGCGRYSPPSDVEYILCDDEEDLINQFLDLWCSEYPDVITGWYIDGFDIPYLINRIINLFGEEKAKRLSPWNYIRKREVKLGNDTNVTYIISGISILDYIALYKKFAPDGKSREQYKLDYICYVELGETKLSYKEYGSLHNLYKENFQLFMDYNVRDTKLVELLEDKLHLLQLAFKMAYHAKCNFDDVFMQTRMWDTLIYNHLLKENIVIPQKTNSSKEEYEGAWVKEPITGKHKWIVSFDFTSLYPKLMMQYNLSNESILDKKDWDPELVEFMKQDINIDNLLNKKIDTSFLKSRNLTLTPNKQLFKIDNKGFLPKILEIMFSDRQHYKNEMKKNKKLLEQNGVSDILLKVIAMYDCFQQAIKVSINSCYGSLGNNFFRFFDVRIAEAVTTSGQLAIHWIIDGINRYLNKLLETDNFDYVIVADTDSMYIVLDKLIEKIYGNDLPDKSKVHDLINQICRTKLVPYINELCIELKEYMNAYAQELEMKMEKICDVGIVIAKKRYIWNVMSEEGIRFNIPQVKIVGLETRRSDFPEWSKNKLSESISYIIGDDETKIHDLVKKCKKEFFALPIEDVSSPTGVNNLAEYSDPTTIYIKGTPIHVRGSLMYNHYLKKKQLHKKYQLIKEGEKIKYVYLKLPNPIKENVVGFSNQLPVELGLTNYVDYDIMFMKVFIDPLQKILNVIGWKAEKKNSLF